MMLGIRMLCQIERLNGQVDIQTELGKGTSFMIRLPLTLAIIVGLMDKVSGRVYAITMNNVMEIERFPFDEIQTIHGEQVIVIRNRIIPVVWLYEVLHYSKQPRKESQ